MSDVTRYYASTATVHAAGVFVLHSDYATERAAREAHEVQIEGLIAAHSKLYDVAVAKAEKLEQAESALAELRARIDGAVPTNWLDPLLSGPKGMGSPPWNCPDIERLLQAIRVRLVREDP